MEWKLHQNAVLTGCLDSFCLICEAHLRTEEDASNHIEKPIHKKNLSSFLYVEKFQDDNIRKVKTGYFCEFCNILLPTLPKVDLHINDEKHRNSKGTLLLQRSGNSIVAYRKVNINESAWNGLIDNICILCSTEFDNENIHKSTATHLINLIRNNVEFTTDNYLFRKIDDTSFHCLTCNRELAVSSKNEHFEDKTHKDLYEKYCAPISTTPEVTKSPETNNNITKTLPKDDLVPPQENKKVEHDKIEPTETIKNAKISSKQTNNNPNDKKQLLEMDKRICNALKATNYIVQEKGEIICILCKISIEGRKHINEHVTSKYHKTILKLHEDQFNKSEDIKRQNGEKADEIDKSKIIDNVSIYQNNDININFEMRTAYCKRCKKHLSFDFKAIENHVSDHKKMPKKDEGKKPQINFNGSSSSRTGAEKKTALFSKPVHIKKDGDSPVVQPSKKVENVKDVSQSSGGEVSVYKPNSNGKPADKSYSEAEMVALGKKNEMSYHRAERRMVCHVCDVKVPANMNNIEQHIKGYNHICSLNLQNKNQPKKETKLNIHKVPCGEFIDTMSTVENLFLKEVILNERFCISANSFMFLTHSELSLKCWVCRCNLTLETMNAHCNMPTHVRAMTEVPVIITLYEEFVREIHPDEYHCGYCNVVQVGYSNLENHLKTVAHRENKNSAINRLQRYEECEQTDRRHIELMMLFRLMNNM